MPVPCRSVSWTASLSTTSGVPVIVTGCSVQLVAGPVAPQQDPAAIDVDQVGHAVAVDVAEQQPARVVAVGQPGRPSHLRRARRSGRGRGWASTAMLPLRSSTMSCSPSPVMSASRTRGSARSTSGTVPLARAGALHARRGSASLNQHSSREPERSTSVSPSPSRSTSLHARVVQPDARHCGVRLERAPAPPARERHREVPGQPVRGDHAGRAGRRRRRRGTGSRDPPGGAAAPR